MPCAVEAAAVAAQREVAAAEEAQPDAAVEEAEPQDVAAEVRLRALSAARQEQPSAEASAHSDRPALLARRRMMKAMETFRRVRSTANSEALRSLSS